MNTQVSSRRFSLIGGIFMLVTGLLALVPNLSVYSQSLPELYIEYSYGYFLSLFAMNVMNKTFLILMGVAGIICANMTNENVTTLTKDTHSPDVWWCRVLLYVSGAMAILGLFSATNTLAGYWPIFGHNVWLNALLAVLGGYFGYAATEDRSVSKQSLRRI